MSTPRSPRYREEVTRILASLEPDYNQGQEGEARDTQIPGSSPQNTMQDVYVVFIRENPDLDAPQVVDSVLTGEPDTNVPQASDLEPLQTPLLDRKESTQLAQIVISMYLLLILSCLMFQIYLIVNPFTVTVTLLTKSQQITLAGTLQLGRVLNPITLSQSQTAQTTGHGHQDARAATGLLTIYNAAFTPQTVDAGTMFTGSDGITIVTNDTVTIPADNPPVIGQTSVLSHSVSAGSQGNIHALDINYAVSSSLYVKNLADFSGGANERNYQTVAQSDIDTISATLKPSLVESMQGALTGQLKNGEQLTALPCSPTVTSDHPTGAEATQVKVTVSETCSAAAYNENVLLAKVTDLLKSQAAKQLGTGYDLLGTVQVSINQATANHTPPLVFLSFHAQGTWVYALSGAAQEHIKSLIKGHTKQDALHILASQPGVEQASISWGDDTKLPKDPRYIHLLVIAGIGG